MLRSNRKPILPRLGLLIGEAARRAGVTVQTLRFYEREGLLPAPQRRNSGYREYAPETIDLVHLISRAQGHGFTLREVKELLALRALPKANCGDMFAVAERKLAEVQTKISDLRALEAALMQLIQNCPGGKVSLDRCPIIDALSGKGSSKEKPPPNTRGS